MTCPEGFVEGVVTPRSAPPIVHALGGVAPAAVPACIRPSESDSGFLRNVLSFVQDIFPIVFPLITLPIIAPKSGAQLGTELVIEDTLGAPEGTVSTAFTIGKAAVQAGLTTEGVMGFFDDVVGGGVEDLFGSIDFGQLTSSLVTEVGLPLLRQELVGQPQPTFVSSPASIGSSIRGAIGSIAGGLGMGLVGTGMALTMKDSVKAILQKIAINKNLKTVPSLTLVMSWVRRMLPVVGQAALAATLAITAEELAQLVMSNSLRKHRRMNAGNVKALRRSMRRLESFHRLCGRADMLRSRGRKRSSSKACHGDRVIVAK